MGQKVVNYAILWFWLIIWTRDQTMGGPGPEMSLFGPKSGKITPFSVILLHSLGHSRRNLAIIGGGFRPFCHPRARKMVPG